MDVRCFTPDEPRRPAPRPVPGAGRPGFVILLIVFFLGGIGLMLLPSWVEWLLR